MSSVLTARRLLRSPAYAISHPRYGVARHSTDDSIPLSPHYER
jgi:hypothetical protein